MRITLARHGETEENAAGIIQGHLPGKLSALGREQARLLGLRLSDEMITHIYCSDLARARDTAAQITKHHSTVPVTVTEDLRERYHGRWQGTIGAEVDKSVRLASPDVETDEQIAARAQSFIRRVVADNDNGRVVLVAHGGVNWAIIGALVGDQRREEMGSMRNAALSVFDLSGNGEDAKVVSHNDTSHLEVIR